MDEQSCKSVLILEQNFFKCSQVGFWMVIAQLLESDRQEFES